MAGAEIKLASGLPSVPSSESDFILSSLLPDVASGGGIL